MTEKISFKKVLAGIFFGFVIGFINGFLGGGAGLIVVLVLTFFMKLPSKSAHATSLLVILPLSVMSSVMYLMQNEIFLPEIINVGIGFVLGGIAGAVCLKQISSNILRFVFSIIMIICGVMSIAKFP